MLGTEDHRFVNIKLKLKLKKMIKLCHIYSTQKYHTLTIITHKYQVLQQLFT